MSTTGNALATRPNGTAPAAQGTAALAIRSNQTMWDDKQRAALVAMGVSDKATNAELAVYFHQCQKLQLDPFQKQIYLIHRKARENGEYVLKPTTQIGIDGFRVIRDRIARRDGVTVEYEDTTWYGSDGAAYDVWLWDEPPAACRFVVKVNGRRFPSVLRFNEYAQRSREGELTGRWKDGFAHQIEKCAEADSLRRAFPNDLSGVILTDAAPLDDPDAPAERQRVTGEQLRARRQHVQSEVIDVQPADVPPPPEPPAGEQADPRDAVLAGLDRLGVTGAPAVASILTRLSGRDVASAESLTRQQAQWFAERLAGIETPDELEAAAVAAEEARHGE